MYIFCLTQQTFYICLMRLARISQDHFSGCFMRSMRQETTNQWFTQGPSMTFNKIEEKLIIAMQSSTSLGLHRKHVKFLSKLKCQRFLIFITKMYKYWSLRRRDCFMADAACAVLDWSKSEIKPEALVNPESWINRWYSLRFLQACKKKIT